MDETKTPKIVVIGGGTGSYTLLSGLKNYVKDLTALVNMADDGGSTGILRDELGVLPPGDARQCLIALSSSEKIREVFSYRFSEGTLDGHNFGNLFLSAVEKMTNSFEEAVKLASEILQIQGQVIPITTTKAQLVLKQQDGEEVRGEFKIGDLNFLGKKKPDLFLSPNAELTEAGKKAIAEAGMVVIAPGNLYGSIAPTLIVDGVRQAIRKSSAKIIYVSNLVTKPHQTDGFMAHDFADEIERLLGAKLLDFVLYNTDEPHYGLVQKYLNEGEKIVDFDLDAFDKKHYHGVGLPMIAKDPVKRILGDKIAQTRSLIRHDSDAVARQIMSIYFG